ncbi:MAG: HAD family hydrolase [Thermodesulfobacteriota bacterium]|nr:HAD family hydrolase [Thermodesulfobacteriota bacterium]
MKKLLLFDFDGVIVDSLELYEEISRRCLEETGKQIIKDREDFLSLFDDNFYEAMRQNGVDVRAFNRAVERLIPQVDYNRIVPFFDLIPIFEKLRKENILVIISSNSLAAIKKIISKYRFDQYFEEVLGADFMFSKIDKIKYALEKWNFSRDDTYFIGDTLGDMKEAKMAGVRTVGVTWGWHPRERLEKAGADFLLDTPDELLVLADSVGEDD